MKLINIGGFHINPDAIAYVSTKTAGSMAPGGSGQSAVVHFIGGGDLTLSVTPGAFAQELEKALTK